MRHFVQRLFVTGVVAIIAFGLAPQVSAGGNSGGDDPDCFAEDEGCPPLPNPCQVKPQTVKKICDMLKREGIDYMDLYKLDNTRFDTCGCGGVTSETCIDDVCTDPDTGVSPTMAPGLSSIESGTGFLGSTCKKKTFCFVPPAGGNLVCETRKVCN